MITIKLPYNSEKDFNDLQRQYTILVKSCYNKLDKEVSNKDIILYIKTLNNIDDLDSRFVENALIDAKSLQKDNKIIFNRTNFFKRLKNKISKETFKENKYLPLVNYGETKQKGNRKFQLDLDNNKNIFKLNRNNHYDIILPQLKPNLYKQLRLVQDLMEENKISISFKLNKTHIFISYEEIKQESIDYKDNRILGLDLNPNNIGISILEFKNNDYTILHKSFISLYENNKSHKNKKNYEIIMISKQLINLMKSYHVGNIAIEDLTMNGKDHNKGKRYNKLVNNTWNRILFVNNLVKRCKINNIKVYKVNPAYTSVIGNLMYDYFDPINASIEVARRGYLFNKMYIKNSFYPKFNLKDPWNQWKKEIGLLIEDWKDFYKYIKTLEMKYRVPIEGLFFRESCIKHIKINIF